MFLVKYVHTVVETHVSTKIKLKPTRKLSNSSFGSRHLSLEFRNSFTILHLNLFGCQESEYGNHS